jgi:hypothetical protein
MPSCLLSGGHECPRVDVDAGAALVQDARAAPASTSMKRSSGVGVALEETVGGEECRVASAAMTSRSLRSRDARAAAGGGGTLQ